MKDHDEMYQSVLSRFDEYQKQKKKRLRIIMLAAPAAACFGLAVAFGIGYYARFAKMPEVSVTPPVAEVSITETSSTSTTTMASSLTDSGTVSPSDTPKGKKTDKKTVPTTVSGHEEQTEQPPSYEVYPPRLDLTTAPNTSSGSRTVHTAVSHRETTKASAVTSVKRTEKSTAAGTTALTSASRQDTDAQTTPFNVTTTTVTTVTEHPIVKKTVKEYQIMYSSLSIYDYESLLVKSYTEFICNNYDGEKPFFSTDIALKELEEKEAMNGGKYPRRRAVILGEISPYAERLNHNKVTEIILDPNNNMAGDYFVRMQQAIEAIQPYPDYVCEGEHGFTEYWLNNAGTEKIVLVPEMGAFVYAVLGD